MMDRMQLLRPGLNSASGAKLLIGPLLKHGHKAFTSWKLRWFVLDDETLRYWATPESEVGDGELGRIDLKDIIKLETTGIAPSKGEAELAFTVHGADRVFQLCAADLKSKQEWLGALTFNIRMLKEPPAPEPVASKSPRRAGTTAPQPIAITQRRNTASASNGSELKSKSASSNSLPRGVAQAPASQGQSTSPRSAAGTTSPRSGSPRGHSPRSATVNTRPGNFLPTRRVTLSRISDEDMPTPSPDMRTEPAAAHQRKPPDSQSTAARVPELRLHDPAVHPPQREPPRKSPEASPRVAPTEVALVPVPIAAANAGKTQPAADRFRPAPVVQKYVPNTTKTTTGGGRLYESHEKVAHEALFSAMASEAEDQELLDDDVQVMIDDLYASVVAPPDPDPDVASLIDLDNASTEVLEASVEFLAFQFATEPEETQPKMPPEHRRRP